MPKVLDAVVIGAGLGGLAAACRLAQEGLRVHVVERKEHPGGTAYSYARAGFTFPMGPLGVSSPDRIRRCLEGLVRAIRAAAQKGSPYAAADAAFERLCQ